MIQIRSNGIERGAFSVEQLYRMRELGHLNGSTEFFSQRKQAWLPLAGLKEDMSPTAQLVGDMKKAGIERVKFLRGGKGDCPACKAIANKVYPIEAVPIIPPADCSCEAWCRLSVVASPEA